MLMPYIMSDTYVYVVCASVSRSSVLGSMGDLEDSESSSEGSEEEDQQDRRPVSSSSHVLCAHE